MLGATWKLVYTQSPLSSLLALGRLPFVTVGDITQTIDPATGTVVNKVPPFPPTDLNSSMIARVFSQESAVCNTGIAAMISARIAQLRTGLKDRDVLSRASTEQ